MIKLGIIEDTPSHLFRIKEKVNDFYPTVKVHWTANSLNSASEKALKHHHDTELVLLDMQLKEGHDNGFDFLDNVYNSIGSIPFGIIIITSHEKYAVDLLKKDLSEFPEFISFIFKWSWNGQSFSQQLELAFEKFEEKGVQIRTRGGGLKGIGSRYLIGGNVYMVKADNSKSYVYTKKEEIASQNSLNDLKQIFVDKNIYLDLDKNENDSSRHLNPTFCKVHRSFLLNIKMIKRIDDQGYLKSGERPHGGVIVLENDLLVPISNTRIREKLKKIVEGG